jgi:hypothetical protein
MSIPRPLSESRQRAFDVLKKHPGISQRAAAKLAGVSRETVRLVSMEYAGLLPKSPVVIGADGKAAHRRRPYITRDGKRIHLRAMVPYHIVKKLDSVAQDIVELPNEKQRHLAIKRLAQLVRKKIAEQKTPLNPDQLTTRIRQLAFALKLLRSK